MSFDEELPGLSEGHAPAAHSDEIRLELARESVSKLARKIEQLTADVGQLEADLAASKLSPGEYEKTKRDLEEALSSARKNLALYKMHERRISQLFSNT